MPIDNAVIEKAITNQIAEQILKGIETEHRDELLKKSIVEALTHYKFSYGIAEVVSERAKEIVAEMVKTDDWSNRIEQAIREGFEQYIINLKDATQRVLMEGMHGTPY